MTFAASRSSTFTLFPLDGTRLSISADGPDKMSMWSNAAT